MSDWCSSEFLALAKALIPHLIDRAEASYDVIISFGDMKIMIVPRRDEWMIDSIGHIPRFVWGVQ